MKTTGNRERCIWVLTGGRTGDDGQAKAVAAALGGSVVEKRLYWSGLHVLPNWLMRASLAGVDHRSTSTLKPPWPDLVIGSGRRSVPIAQWIRRSSHERTRIIFLGRPRAPLGWFDLVITTPQYGLPLEANVARAGLPFVAAKPTPDDLESWRSRWSDLERPLIGLLVGGSTYPYRLTQDALWRILRDTQSVAGKGTIIVVTSPRTSAAAAQMLRSLVRLPHELHLWSARGPNPYGSLLATADHFVVTEDSATMLAEALDTARSVSVAFLPRWPLPSWSTANGIARLLSRSGVFSPPRDVRRVAAAAIAGGRANLLGNAGSMGATVSRQGDDWELILARARILLEQSRRPS